MAQTSNPDKQHVKEANVIVTRSGKEIDGPTPPSSITPNTSSNKDEAPKAQEAPSDSMPVPFPQALIKPKERNSALQGEILEQLKQVRINLPLLHVIKQVPSYAKVIKDLCTLKRKHNVKKTAFLAEQASAVIDSKTPPKYKDPGCPTVACQIGNQACGQALLDLGASVNLMPYSVYLQLGLGEIKPTTVVLQLADRSVRKPRGIVEDVLVQIDKFYYPVDFLVLDTIAIVNTESKIPLILGRPFLATANALINCRNGLMTLSFGNMTLEIDDSYSHAVNVLNVFDKSQGFVKKSWQPCFEELPKERETPKPSSEEVPTPTLAPLPKGLKHAFLGPGDIFPVIISSELNDVQSDKLLDLLREHKTALGWTIADIKGISPLICSHRIHLEEGANPRRDPQRRLNPTMKEMGIRDTTKLRFPWRIKRKPPLHVPLVLLLFVECPLVYVMHRLLFKDA
ncbi:hypothetical protein UlMin_041701 [Ulmus minor]